jgi:AbrB family looped-hinge helix DNA binding protein
MTLALETFKLEEQGMAIPLVRVQEKGQVTIPLEIRKKLNLKKGDLVTFVETEDGVVIQRAEVVAAQSLDEIGKALQAKGIRLDELIERGRELRGEIIEEEYGLSDNETP